MQQLWELYVLITHFVLLTYKYVPCNNNTCLQFSSELLLTLSVLKLVQKASDTFCLSVLKVERP
jgi:hypothetical protein